MAALCIGVASDGVIESVYESFRSESLSQLWLHKLYLTNRYPLIDHTKTIVGYDDGCHYHAYVTNPSRANATASAAIVAQQDIDIDNMHLKGHTDKSCRINFSPKRHPVAKEFNTQVAEQTFSWFARFKHIGRHMSRESYWIFSLGLFHERNKIFAFRHQAKRGVKRTINEVT